MNNTGLSKAECTMMRAIAIMGIVLHNYCHWLGSMVKENEYMFSEVNVRRILVEMSSPSLDIFSHLLSFFGHYGVPVFVFISAYGLVKKYESPQHIYDDDKGVWHFVKIHYMKLFTLMIVGYVGFVLVDYMTARPHHYEWWNVVGMLGMFANFYDDPDKAIWPGPFWYFGLTIQLYIVYRFILYPGKSSLSGMVKVLKSPYVLVGVMLTFIFCQLLFEPEGEALNRFRYNCTGHIPVFIFGLLYARYDLGRFVEGKTLHAAIALLATILVVVFSLNFTMWTIAPLLVVIGTICTVKVMPQSMVGVMTWIGGLSSYMFISHPATRKILFPIAQRGDLYAGLLLYTISTIMVAMLVKRILESKKEVSK